MKNVKLNFYFFGMKKNKIHNAVFIIVFQIFLLESCDNAYRLDSRDRTIVDTTANSQIAKITKNLADTALVNHGKNVKKISDSLVEFQLKAIAEKLNFSKQKK